MNDQQEAAARVAALRSEALGAIASCGDESGLNDLRVRYLGKKGPVQALLKSMGSASMEERRAVGAAVNDLKIELEAALDGRLHDLFDQAYASLATTEWADVTLPGQAPRRGHIHPIAAVQRELEGIFTSMGFAILDGPEVEDDYHNFTALNIPKDHPARDMQDTFWTEDGNLLRTHTSPIQIRGLGALKPPFRVIGPGRVFRYEATDASHENTFYQMEGMMVGEDISVANVIYTMKVLLREIFKKDVTVRLRPGYFPFVEPGFELDMRCLICGGAGCPVCKQSGWVEVLPCGLVNPNVLRMAGLDTDRYSGFAFGLGLSRLVMLRYDIPDVRYFLGGDIRFLSQFD